MQQQFNPNTFYQQEEQGEKAITPLVFLFIVGSAFLMLFHFILFLVEVDYEISRYIYLVTGLINIALYVLILLVGIRTKMKKLKGWIIAFSIILLLIRLFWFVRSVAENFFDYSFFEF